MFKVVIFVTLLAAAYAGYLAPAAPLLRAPLAAAPLGAAHLLRSPYAAAPLAAGPLLRAPLAAAPIAEQYDPNPQYSFGYDVQDGLTGDSKNHFETRNGDVVQGSYSLTDPDGTRRIVEYVADWVNGFNAIVRKEPLVAAAPIAAAPLLHSKALLH